MDYFSVLFFYTTAVLYSENICSNDYAPVGTNYLLYRDYVDAFWPYEDSNQTSDYLFSAFSLVGYVSRARRDINPRCLEILKTNVLAPADCSLPPGCGSSLWHRLEISWLGTEIGLCYSMEHSLSPDSLYSVYALNATLADRVDSRSSIVDVALSHYPILVVDSSSGLYSQFSPSCMFEHVFFDLSHQTQPLTQHQAVIKGDFVCLQGYKDIGCELNWKSFPEVMADINPLLLVKTPSRIDITSQSLATKSVYCNFTKLTYDVPFSVGEVNRTVSYASKDVFGVFEHSKRRVAHTSSCHPIHAHYVNPASKILASSFSYILGLVLSTLSGLFSDIEGLIDWILDTLGKVFSHVFKYFVLALVKYRALQAVLLAVLYYAFVDQSISRAFFSFFGIYLALMVTSDRN